jgi:hypothetical protein
MANLDELLPVGLAWVPLYGGPGDGYEVPIDQEDPMPFFAYYNKGEGRTYWYTLAVRNNTAFQYVLEGIQLQPGWKRLYNR